MRLPAPSSIARGLAGVRDAVQARGSSSNNEPATTTTAEALAGQWGNPTDISTTLMIIGGDIVQKALAQGTGLWYFTPVCFSFGWVSYAFIALVIIAVQFGLAVGPIVLYEEWDIMMIIAVGTFLAQIAGSLPQWRAEKLPNRQRRAEVYALTQGNGSREVVVIFGKGECLDLEELATLTNPRGGKLWEKFTGDNMLTAPQFKGVKGRGSAPRTDSELCKSRKSYGLPLGFWLTRIVVTVQLILWLLLLVNVSTPRESNWFLLGIGAIGMFQNSISAGSECDPKHRNIPVHKVNTIRSQKVMDGIMDFEVTYGLGKPLLHEFFPGDLQEDEKDWSAGDREAYDNKRQKDGKSRGTPRTRLSQQHTQNPHPSGPECRVPPPKHSPVNTPPSDGYQVPSSKLILPSSAKPPSEFI